MYVVLLPLVSTFFHRISVENVASRASSSSSMSIAVVNWQHEVSSTGSSQFICYPRPNNGVRVAVNWCNSRFRAPYATASCGRSALTHVRTCRACALLQRACADKPSPIFTAAFFCINHSVGSCGGLATRSR